jgi:hypothetical protein
MVMGDWLRTHRRKFSRMAREMVERNPHFQEQLVRHGWGEPLPYEDALNHQVFAIGWQMIPPPGREKLSAKVGILPPSS